MLRLPLLQVPELSKAGLAMTIKVQDQVAQQGPTHLFFFWTTIILLSVSAVLGWGFYKLSLSLNDKVDAATKVRLAGFEKAEETLKQKHEECLETIILKHQQALKDLGEKHALEIGINEGNHQSILKGMQRALDESHAERRALSEKLTVMADDLKELFDRFATKMQTFAELQANQIAYLQSLKGEILLEITRFFSSK